MGNDASRRKEPWNDADPAPIRTKTHGEERPRKPFNAPATTTTQAWTR